MPIDVAKFRRMSAFVTTNGNSDFERELTIQQAIQEFDTFQSYSPNTHVVYVNGDYENPIHATMTDVSDLEVGTDTKWCLTSLDNYIKCGDIIDWNGEIWMNIYEKTKNTGNSCKCKIQHCNYPIKLPFYKEENVPDIYIAHAIYSTYLTDTRDFKQPFPTESGTTFAMIQLNDTTKTLIRESRVWIFNSAFKIVGVDYTGINHYKNEGYIKWTLRPVEESSDLDNKELGVCDYYKYFKKEVVTPEKPISVVELSASIKKVRVYSDLIITATAPEEVEFNFDGDSCDCLLINNNDNSCLLKANGEVGIVYVKAYLKSNPSTFSTIRIIVSSGW